MLRTRTLACVLGRFNPFHFEHHGLFEAAFDSADLVCGILGSHRKALTSHDPFTCKEREEQIRANFTTEANKHLVFVYAEDFPDDKDWAENIRVELSKKISVSDKIYLMEFHKDQRTSSAITFLRQTLGAEAKEVRSDNLLSATAARRAIFLEDRVPSWLTPGVRTWIQENNYLFSNRHMVLKREQQYLDRHFEKIKNLPYPYQANAADAICISEGKVLLIERKSDYGFGQLANSGGMLEPNETVLQCALRETEEETCLSGLRPYLVNRNPIIFDDPYRSLRGRVISHAFLFDLPAGFFAAARTTPEAGRIVPMDIGQLDNHKADFFEDHYHMIRQMLELR